MKDLQQKGWRFWMKPSSSCIIATSCYLILSVRSVTQAMLHIWLLADSQWSRTIEYTFSVRCWHETSEVFLGYFRLACYAIILQGHATVWVFISSHCTCSVHTCMPFMCKKQAGPTTASAWYSTPTTPAFTSLIDGPCTIWYINGFRLTRKRVQAYETHSVPCISHRTLDHPFWKTY